ncbi:pseudouridine synthase [Eremomyces bilateralis CBS 781.70]|uniref:Pseudouridine synthase n=1 Tax=Eremomyces bilateralis CBS 781.70 TaxID=1392243 RepID=A0A6G1G6B1_9PEZI|nr:pseudouridine synthase [Eremomyces bilateralis CBS 781.70]KAF1813466.1 pseudouridine synthase [Eremomyces bilateralis CBS 781.70]
MQSQIAPYTNWSSEQFIARISDLESQLKSQNIQEAPPQAEQRRRRKPNQFDPSRYNTRFIALKLAYLGRHLNGYEAPGDTIPPAPTVEEELWKALMKTRLIFPRIKRKGRKTRDIYWEGCDYSKCGRTDKGVSSFGQVIGIRVRSNKPLPKTSQPQNNTASKTSDMDAAEASERTVEGIADPVDVEEEETPFDPIKDEIPYIHLLNQLLPPEIRILAWCPSPPPGFSARFSCRERRYKYFFTQPAYLPIPGAQGSRAGENGGSWLDIDKMKEAASYFLGNHDFRNFAKMDATRQLTNFERVIFHTDIEEIASLDDPAFLSAEAVSGSAGSDGNSSPKPKVYAFVVHGSAFLYNQVRHMAAILFLVGQGLEKPTIVKELLDVRKNPRRPNYEIASDSPLVLWDCVFPGENSEKREDALDWVYPDDPSNVAKAKTSAHGGKWGLNGLVDVMWSTWRSRKIDEVHAAQLMQVTAMRGRGLAPPSEEGRKSSQKRSIKVFDGGNVTKPRGVYTPVMKLELLETPDVINAKWAAKKGITPLELPREGPLGDSDE